MPRVLHRICLVLGALLFTFGSIRANDLRISDGKLSYDRDSIYFRITWENAWNLEGDTIGNHDAVWVFIKEGGYPDQWRHLDLSGSGIFPDDPGQVQASLSSDGLGFFLSPSATGAGQSIDTWVRIALREPLPPAYQIWLKVFGIEMVFVPEGATFLGDSLSTNTFYEASSGAPFIVSSEDVIDVGQLPGMLGDGGQYAPASAIPAEYPKGFSGFYCMKYEMSQRQYAEFLNCLSADQQASRTVNGPGSSPGSLALSGGPANRNGIRLEYNGFSTQYGLDGDNDGLFADSGEGEDRACNWLDWDDLCAYLDWAGLRPMTEFEFETACRGPVYPLPQEFAWGTDQVADANELSQDGFADESASATLTAGQGLASHGYDGPQGPLRCGFAAAATTNRLQAGASYWGIMELSGNLWEQCVTVNEAGLAFTGENGDGSLDAQGNADVSAWPGAGGAGFRGGGWNSGILPGFRDLAVSDRFYAGLAPLTRRPTSGGRGVRRP